MAKDIELDNLAGNELLTDETGQKRESDQKNEAEVPEMEMFGYCTVLRSMTGGIGQYEVNFDHYEQAPRDVQEKEVAKRAAEKEE